MMNDWEWNDTGVEAMTQRTSSPCFASTLLSFVEWIQNRIQEGVTAQRFKRGSSMATLLFEDLAEATQK